MNIIKTMRLNWKIHKLICKLYTIYSEDELYKIAERYGRVYTILPTDRMKERFIDELLGAVEDVR